MKTSSKLKLAGALQKSVIALSNEKYGAGKYNLELSSGPKEHF